MGMVEVKFYEQVNDELLKFSFEEECIVAKKRSYL